MDIIKFHINSNNINSENKIKMWNHFMFKSFSKKNEA